MTYKSDIKDQNTKFEKKQKDLENEIAKLVLFKNLKLEEEKEKKLAKKKELKKANQKEKKELILQEKKVNIKVIEKDIVTVTEDGDGIDVKEEVDKKEDVKLETDDSLKKSDYFLYDEPDAHQLDVGKEAAHDDVEGIGPKLPNLMTESEKEEFFGKIFAKFDVSIARAFGDQFNK